MTVEDVLTVLERAGLPIDHQPGENGVASRCPLCRREMAWVETWRPQAFVCDGRCDSAQIARELASAAYPANAPAAGLRLRGVVMERVRPMPWLWERRIPIGAPSLLVGNEGVGKGTLSAWIIARVTRGELPGDRHGTPMRVLIIGDEDDFESIWVPRLHAAGADLSMLRTPADGETLDLHARADDLAVAVRTQGVGMVLFDQLLDHIGGGRDGSAVYNPKSVREAMLPLRRVAGECGIAALAHLHPTKGRASTFRDLVAGSHQFNAVSRSSLLLADDPDDPSRRVLVRGKGNHSAAPASFEFRLGVRRFELNGHDFEVPVVDQPTEGRRSVADLLGGGTHAPVRTTLADQLGDVLTGESMALADLARAVGRDPKDGSVRRALATLKINGRATQTADGQWCHTTCHVGTGAGAGPLRGPGTRAPHRSDGTPVAPLAPAHDNPNEEGT